MGDWGFDRVFSLLVFHQQHFPDKTSAVRARLLDWRRRQRAASLLLRLAEELPPSHWPVATADANYVNYSAKTFRLTFASCLLLSKLRGEVLISRHLENIGC
jgi:hypothetical protein